MDGSTALLLFTTYSINILNMFVKYIEISQQGNEDSISKYFREVRLDFNENLN